MITCSAGPRLGRWLDLRAVAVLGVALVVVLRTRDDYGITWDEPAHMDYGDAALRTLASLGRDSAGASRRDHENDPSDDLVGAIVRSFSPLGRYDTKWLLEHPGEHSPSSRGNEVELAAGTHLLRIGYHEQRGQSAAWLSASLDGRGPRQVPNDFLRRSSDDRCEAR